MSQFIQEEKDHTNIRYGHCFKCLGNIEDGSIDLNISRSALYVVMLQR